jgi:ribosome-associated toxin RatA of RatAB toxin-antitoxin module
MAIVRKSVIVPHARTTMFALVDDVESYPQFLPWCPGTEVFERTAELTRARLEIDYHGLKSHIETVNRKRAPEFMTLEFVDGPFREFSGAWSFASLGEHGCRVELALEYAFSSGVLEATLGPVFGHIMETLVDRFVARAEQRE